MSMINNLLRWIRVIRPGVDDPSKFHIQQIEYMGKVADALMIFPYGVHANVPEDAFGISFSIQGNPDNRGAIAWVPKGRPKLAGGEVAFYHPPTDAFLIWRSNGDLDIETGNSGTGKINIVASDVTINATLTTIDGDLTVTGNTELDGDLTVTDNTVLGGTVTSNGTDISGTHVHSQPVDGDGDTEFDTGFPHS